MRLSDRVVIVTGARSGLGLAYARQLAEQGAAVVLADIQECNSELHCLTASNARTLFVRTDVRCPQDAQQLANATLSKFGRIDVLITVKGRAAHSSTPWEGLDAVAGAREVMNRLDALDVGDREHKGLGKATLALTSIHSFPEATHTIQGEVRMVYDRRLLPGDSPEKALAQIRAALDKVGRWKVDVVQGPEMYPSELATDSRLVECIMKGYRDANLPPPPFFYSHGSLDAGLFTKEGIEATMWGPGQMGQWHSDDEYILVSDLCRGADAYYAFMREYLKA